MLIKQENDTINCTDEFAEIYINVTIHQCHFHYVHKLLNVSNT